LITKPRQKRLLIAVEEESIRETLCALFEDEGYRVFSKKSLNITLGTINKCSLDVVLIGIEEQKGMKIIGHIKEVYPDLPIIVISHEEDTEVVESIGAITWLVMPVSLEAILLAVKKSCNEICN
jgi:DNA-binding NtrC family response regulator